jgi:hypothetical protein
VLIWLISISANKFKNVRYLFHSNTMCNNAI